MPRILRQKKLVIRKSKRSGIPSDRGVDKGGGGGWVRKLKSQRKQLGVEKRRSRIMRNTGNRLLLECQSKLSFPCSNWKTALSSRQSGSRRFSRSWTTVKFEKVIAIAGSLKEAKEADFEARLKRDIWWNGTWREILSGLPRSYNFVNGTLLEISALAGGIVECPSLCYLNQVSRMKLICVRAIDRGVLEPRKFCNFTQGVFAECVLQVRAFLNGLLRWNMSAQTLSYNFIVFLVVRDR